MPYREKIAWLSLIAMAVAFGPYFTFVALAIAPDAALPNLRLLALFALAALVQVTILGVGHLVLRRREPTDSRLPPDERDQAIRHRSVTTAYYVLITGMILVGVIMPFHAAGWQIINAALFAIIVAELVSYSVAVVSYRRFA